VLRSELTLGPHRVGPDTAPFVIAEAGSNFNQDLDTARRLIDVAAEAGAQAVKFQLFLADVLYPGGGELHEIFRSIELNAEWIPLLAEHASQQGLLFLASAFDLDSVDVLEAVGVAAHKAASSEATNLGFLHVLASTGKPLILSTGMCDMVDVEEAVTAVRATGADRLVLLQCGAQYPLPSGLANLRALHTLAARFRCPVGFSDHTLGSVAALAAVGAGATVFEKHFTLDRSAPGPDHAYAMEPAELRDYVAALHEAHAALGTGEKGLLQSEREIGRREGLYAARELRAGTTIGADDVRVKRPALGLRARYAGAIAGARLTSNVAEGEPLTWEVLSFGRGPRQP
jgi:sialic acid synthase SpsE